MRRAKGTVSKLVQSGFTLIEVTLSMGFIAFIITILAATTVNIVRTYTKGMWLSQINSTGQQIISDLGTTARYNTAPTVNDDKQRICFRNVVYAWNTADQLKSTAKNTYNSHGYSLIRVTSKGGDDLSGLCEDRSSQNISDTNRKVQVMMGRGVRIQAMSAKQSPTMPILEVKLVAGTEGENNQPHLTYESRGGELGVVSDVKAYYSNGDAPADIKEGETPHWQCGDIVDGTFTPSRNQYCAYAEYDVILFERSVKE